MTRTVLLTLCCLLALFAARLLCLGASELSPDEAYYSMWAERLDWAYYSKGPGVAFVIRASTQLFGMNEFGVRFFSPVLSLATSLVVFAFTRRLYGEGPAAFTVALLNCAPIFNVGSVVMTIDPLSIFFWISAVATFWLALEKPGFSWWWPFTGLLIGLGFLCKYTNALLLVSVALVLWVFPRHHSRLLQSGVYSLLLSFAVCALPPIIWNIGNDWVTAQHIWTRGGLTKTDPWTPLELLQFLGVHFGVYSPLIFVVLVVALVRGVQDWRVHNRARYIMCFALPIIALYYLISFKEAGEANWTAPGFATLAIYASHVWWDKVVGSHFWRVAMATTLGVGIALSVVVLNTDLVRAVLKSIGSTVEWSYAHDPSTRLRGWKSAAEALAAMRTEQSRIYGEPLFLIANKYGTAAALGFYLPEKSLEAPEHPPIYTPETQTIESQFSFWPRYDEFVIPAAGTPASVPDGKARFTEERGVNLFAGRSALFVTDDVEPDLSAPKNPDVRQGFELSRWVGDLIIERRGQRVRVLRVFRCEGYKTRDL